MGRLIGTAWLLAVVVICSTVLMARAGDSMTEQSCCSILRQVNNVAEIMRNTNKCEKSLQDCEGRVKANKRFFYQDNFGGEGRK